jgi:hypothetical protein
MGWAGRGFELTRAMRDVLLGTDPPVRLTTRATDRLAFVRGERHGLVHPGGNLMRCGVPESLTRGSGSACPKSVRKPWWG